MARKKKQLPYPDYSVDVNEKMMAVCEFIAGQNGGTIPPKDLLILDKLADLLHLYEEVRAYNLQHGLTRTDRNGNVTKSDLLKTQLEVFTQIMKICNCYGLTLKDERKLKVIDNEAQDPLTDALDRLDED